MSRSGLRGALVTSILFLLGVFGCVTLRGGVEYNRALQAYKNHQYEVAEGLLGSTLSQNPGDERAISLLGWVRFKQGKMAEAGKLFAEAGRIDSENIMTVEGLGWVQYAFGEDEKAEKNFNKLIHYAEKHFVNPDWLYYERNDREIIQSVYSEGSFGLGLIAKRRGKWEEARKRLEEAFNQPNRFIDHHMIAKELADILFQLRDYQTAAIFYKDSISHNPLNPLLLNRYAWCLYESGNYGEAKSIFLRSKELSLRAEEFDQDLFSSPSVTQRLRGKRIAEPYYGLALIYIKERRLDAAQEELASALKISPYFHHPHEISLLLAEHPEWQERLRLKSLGRSLP
ncbi:MAG: tetratricopeptide repeat protein [Thermodesulfobacteriota bacterium]